MLLDMEMRQVQTRKRQSRREFNFKREFSDLIKAEGFVPRQFFNVDETF